MGRGVVRVSPSSSVYSPVILSWVSPFSKESLYTKALTPSLWLTKQRKMKREVKNLYLQHGFYFPVPSHRFLSSNMSPPVFPLDDPCRFRPSLLLLPSWGLSLGYFNKNTWSSKLGLDVHIYNLELSLVYKTLDN